jgi:hypothetical protein
MELEQIVEDVGAALVAVDGCGVAFKKFQPGVGPYGEPQLFPPSDQRIQCGTSSADAFSRGRHGQGRP